MKITYLLLLSAFLSLSVSCRKDRDAEPSKKSHRIKQVLLSDKSNYEYEKLDFLYDGDKLVSITNNLKDNSGSWVVEEKIEISYSGDNILETGYENVAGNLEIGAKSEYVVQNGLMMEELYYILKGGTWVKDNKCSYQYSGTDITAWQSYNDENNDGILEQNGKGEYAYQDGKLSEYKNYKKDGYGSWYQDNKTTFVYEGNKLISWIDHKPDGSQGWLNNVKVEFLYSGDYVLQRDIFWWYSALNIWKSLGSRLYSFNSDGYLIEESEVEGNKMTCEYEEGSGNATCFFYRPEDLVYGEPTFKSTDQYRLINHIPYYKRLKFR